MTTEATGGEEGAVARYGSTAKRRLRAAPVKTRCAPGSREDGDGDGGVGEDAAATAAAESEVQCDGAGGEGTQIPAKRGHESESGWWCWVWGVTAHPRLPFIGAGELQSGVEEVEVVRGR